ncbi:MAG: PadR family transcriptional regulator [Bacteroidota bacterium]|jgi:PadR family transcriptional regulator PadR
MKLAGTSRCLNQEILEYCILHLISKGEINSSDLAEQLTEAQLIEAEGSIYPLLHRLKSEAWLSTRVEQSEGNPSKKYYLLTEAGKKSLGNYAHNWKKLTSTVQTHLKKK